MTFGKIGVEVKTPSRQSECLCVCMLSCCKWNSPRKLCDCPGEKNWEGRESTRCGLVVGITRQRMNPVIDKKKSKYLFRWESGVVVHCGRVWKCEFWLEIWKRLEGVLVLLFSNHVGGSPEPQPCPSFWVTDNAKWRRYWRYWPQRWSPCSMGEPPKQAGTTCGNFFKTRISGDEEKRPQARLNSQFLFLISSFTEKNKRKKRIYAGSWVIEGTYGMKGINVNS